MFKKAISIILVALMITATVPVVFASAKNQWDFNDGNISGWTNGGTGGTLTASDSKVSFSGGDAWFISPIRMQNFTLEADITPQSGQTGFIFRSNSDGSVRNAVVIYTNTVKFFNIPDYGATVTETAGITISYGATYKLKITVKNDSLSIIVNGALAFTKTIAAPIANQDYMGLLTYYGSATIDNYTATEDTGAYPAITMPLGNFENASTDGWVAGANTSSVLSTMKDTATNANPGYAAQGLYFLQSVKSQAAATTKSYISKNFSTAMDMSASKYINFSFFGWGGTSTGWFIDLVLTTSTGMEKTFTIPCTHSAWGAYNIDISGFSRRNAISAIKLAYYGSDLAYYSGPWGGLFSFDDISASSSAINPSGIVINPSSSKPIGDFEINSEGWVADTNTSSVVKSTTAWATNSNCLESTKGPIAPTLTSYIKKTFNPGLELDLSGYKVFSMDVSNHGGAASKYAYEVILTSKDGTVFQSKQYCDYENIWNTLLFDISKFSGRGNIVSITIGFSCDGTINPDAATNWGGKFFVDNMVANADFGRLFSFENSSTNGWTTDGYIYSNVVWSGTNIAPYPLTGSHGQNFLWSYKTGNPSRVGSFVRNFASPVDLSNFSVFSYDFICHGGHSLTGEYAVDLVLTSNAVSRKYSAVLGSDAWRNLQFYIGDFAERNAITQIKVDFHSLNPVDNNEARMQPIFVDNFRVSGVVNESKNAASSLVLTKTGADEFVVKIKDWNANYKYQIWSYQKIESDFMGVTPTQTNQWILEMGYTLGSNRIPGVGFDVNEDGSISKNIGTFMSTDSNYTVSVKILDQNGNYVTQLKETFTQAAAGVVKISKILVDSKITGDKPEIKEIKQAGSSISIDVIGNNVPDTTFIAFTNPGNIALPATVPGGNQFIWNTSTLAPGKYSIVFKATNGLNTDSKTVYFELYKVDPTIRYGLFSGENPVTVSGAVDVPSNKFRINITPTGIDTNFISAGNNPLLKYTISEPWRSNLVYGSHAAANSMIQNDVIDSDKYGIYQVTTILTRGPGSADDGITRTVENPRPGTKAPMLVNVQVGAQALVSAGLSIISGTKDTKMQFDATATLGTMATTPTVETAVYSYWRRDARGWIMIRDYSSSPLEWTPARVGFYSIQVRAKGTTSSTYESVKNIEFDITDATDEKAVLAGDITLDGATGAMSRAPIVLTAGATALIGANTEKLMYKYIISNGFIYYVETAYSADPTYAWIPGKAGAYNISVLVKSDVSFGKYDAMKTFAVTVG